MSNTCALHTIGSIKRAADQLENTPAGVDAVDNFYRHFNNKSNLSPAIVMDVVGIYLSLPKERRGKFLLNMTKVGGTDTTASEALDRYKKSLADTGINVEENMLLLFSHYDYSGLIGDLNAKMNPIDKLLTFKDGGTSLDTRVVKYSENESTTIKAKEAELLSNILIRDNGSSLFKGDAGSLEEATTDHKVGGSDSIKIFLDMYFANMNIHGAVFTDWALLKFAPVIVEFTQSGKGLMSNVDEDMATLKRDLNATIKSNIHIRYEDELTDKYLSDNIDVRDKYFNEVLFKEFDFIVDNLVKSLAVDMSKTFLNNQKLSGIKYEYSESFELLLNLKDIKEEFIFNRRAKEYTSKNPIELIDINSNTKDFLSRNDLSPGMLYRIVLDDKIFYKTTEGSIDISPTRYYTLNTKNKHNQSSINSDSGIAALDEGTAFINNLITLIPRINKAGTHLGYLTIADYMTISPFLLEYGGDMDEFVARLKELAEKNDRIGNVALSLKVHLFDLKPDVLGADFTNIYSIRNKYNRGVDPFKYNMLAVNAMYNALTSKEYYRFIRLENGRTIISRELNLKVDDYFLDSNLADILVSNGYTKDSLTPLLEVANKGKDLYVRSSPHSEQNKLKIDKNLKYGDIIAPSDMLGFSKFLNLYYEKLGKAGHNKTTIEGKVTEYFKKLVQIAAANIKSKKSSDRWYPDNINSNASDKSIADYTNLRPSALLYGIDYDIIGEIYNPDTTKNARVAGATRSTIGPTNRNGAIAKQSKMFKTTVEKRFGANVITYNPLVFDNPPVPKAEYKGYYVKTAIKNGDNVLSVYNWDMKTRIEYAMIQGFLDGPARVQGELPGENFFVQPTNYADKKNAQMVKLLVKDAKFFSSDSSAFNDLKDGYIAYHAVKNEDFQRMMIDTFTSTMLSQYTDIRASLDTEENREEFDKLVKFLENSDLSLSTGDFTRAINNKLQRVGITEDILQFSNSDLIKDSDYIAFPDGKVYLNPVLGIKAGEFRERGGAIVEELLAMHREDLKEFGVDDIKIESALKFISGRGHDTFTITDADTFYDRFFLVNGIYGHAAKTIMMGDESFFMSGATIKEMNVKTIDGFYRKKSEVIYRQKAMLTGQFKRAQSNITSGNKIRHSKTVIGLQLHNSKKNIINHAQIRDNGTVTYSFKALENRPLVELRGEGVVPTGGVIHLDANNGFALDLIVGNTEVRFNPEQEYAAETMNELDINLEMFNSISKFVYNVYSTNAHDAVDGDTSPSFKTLPTDNLLQRDIDSMYTKMGDKKSITMPDYIPSILLTEPISYLSLMNSIDEDVENIDGAQYIHPLLHLIMNYARGGKFSAYNLDQNEALKTIATTFDYSRFTHTLQKKAVFMPFSLEQMQKLAGVEMYNSLTKMGTAVPFMKTTMSYIENDVSKILEAENLHELFEELGGFGITPDTIWERVLNVLAQNPENLFSFVGYLSLPSLVKTGRRKFNSYDTFFSRTVNSDKVQLDYTSNEHSFEVLNKAHDYDVTRGSTIALLSQLVNAIANGGVSEITNEVMHEALSAAMDVSKTSLLMDFKNMSAELRLNDNSGNVDIYDKIADMFSNGKLSPSRLNEEETVVYNKVIRETMQDILMQALSNDDDVDIVRDILADSSKSLDTPIVYSKVMNTMRAYLYKVIKLKMNGFIAVVSPMHNNVKMFTNPQNQRTVRGAFINSVLEGVQNGVKEYEVEDKYFINGGRLAQYTAETADLFSKAVLPFDPVLVSTDNRVSTKLFGRLTTQELEKSAILGVITPDFDEAPVIDSIEKFNDIDPLQLVSISGERPYYKWYIEQKYGAETLVDLAADGAISLNDVEKYTLNWYQYKNTLGVEYRNTPTFKNFYTALMDKEADHIVAKFRGRVVMDLKSVGKSGDPVWVTKAPEVILPPFMAGAFNLPSNVSLHTIIGYDGNKLANAITYFTAKNGGKKDFKPVVNGANGVFRTSIKRKLNARYLYTTHEFIKDALKVLSSSDTDIVSVEDVIKINNIIENARIRYAEESAESFIEALSVVLTRIPGQAKQSGFNGEIVEFLGAQGNAAMAPSAHMVSTGGDFDIDTFSVLTSSLTVEGLIFQYKKYITADRFDKKGFMLSYNSKLKSIDKAVEEFAKEHNKHIETLIQAFESEKDGATINNKKIATAREKILTADRVLKKKREIKEIVVSEYNNIIGNVIKSSISKALSNPRAAVEVNTAVTMDYLKELKDVAARFNNIEDVATAAEAYTSIFKAEELAAQGAEAIAIFATSLKVYSAILTSKHIFDTYYKGKKAERTRSILFKDVMPVSNRSISFTSFYSLSGAYSLNKLLSEDTVISYSDTEGSDAKAVILSGEPSIKGLQAKKKDNLISFDITLKTPLVLDLISKEGVPSMLSEAASSGYDSVIIKGNSAVDTLVYILKPEEVIDDSSIDEKSKVVEDELFDPFAFEHTIQFTDPETGKTIKRYSSGFVDTVSFSIEKIINNDESVRNSLITLSNGSELFDEEKTARLVDILIAGMGEKEMSPEFFKGVVLAQFNLEDSSINDKLSFEEYLYNNPESIENIYMFILGKRKSDEVQSQLLSAATDNAKELILGKIRSNEFTNGIFTSMLLLGYDLEDIIRFVHDKEFEDILIKAKEKKRRFEFAKIMPSMVGDATPFTRSLSSLIRIADNLSVFRGIRSLNEDFKIEQFRLDKIFNNLQHDKLFNAIEKNDISLLQSITKGRDEDVQKDYNIFVPEVFVFLHPQSREMFMRLYEVEKLIIPALVETPALVAELAEKETEDSYKRVESYLAEMKVIYFLAKTKKVAYVYNEDNVFDGPVIEEIPLSLQKDREAFVTNFPSYLTYVENKLKELGKSKPAIYEFLGSVKFIMSTYSTVSIPGLKFSLLDPVKKAIIGNSVTELKTGTGNVEVDALKAQLYNNLSLYALITSGGKAGKDSMLGLFSEVNLEIGDFLHTSGLKEIADNMPKSDDERSLLSGTLKSGAELKIAGKKKKKRGGIEEDGVGMDLGDMYNGSREELGPLDDDAMSAMFNSQDEDFIKKKAFYNKYNKEKYKYKETGQIHYTAKRIFTSDILGMEGVPFLGPDNFLEPPVRIFPIGRNEVMSNDIIGATVNIPGYSVDIASNLSNLGYQLGFSAVYKGSTDVKILTFVGIKKKQVKDGFRDYHEYLVFADGELLTVPAEELLIENPDLFLYGNVIENVNNFNIKDKEKLYSDVEDMYEKLGPSSDGFNTSYSIKESIASVFDIENIKKSPNVLSEAVAMSMADNVLKVDKGIVESDQYLKNIIDSESIFETDEYSNSVFIPGIRFNSIETFDTGKELYYKNVSNKVNVLLNSIDVGEAMSFYTSAELSGNSEDGHASMFSGYNVMSVVFNVKAAGNTVIKSNNLQVKIEEIDKARKITKFTVTRLKAFSEYRTMMDGRNVKVQLESKGDKVQKLSEIQRRAVVKLIYDGTVQKPAKIVKVLSDVDGITDVVLFYTGKGYKMYSIEDIGTIDSIVIEVKKEGKNSKYIKTIDKVLFDTLVDDIIEENSNIEVVNNLKC